MDQYWTRRKCRFIFFFIPERISNTFQISGPPQVLINTQNIELLRTPKSSILSEQFNLCKTTVCNQHRCIY